MDKSGRTKRRQVSWPDDFSSRLLKKNSEEIAYPVAILFNMSVKEGDVPLDSKAANITPVIKKGSRNNPETTDQSVLLVTYPNSWNQ